MKKVTIDVPEEVIRASKIPPNEVPDRLRNELAVRLYDQGIVSFGKARQLAGATKWEFHRLLGQMGIARQYEVEDLDTDLDTLEHLG